MLASVAMGPIFVYIAILAALVASWVISLFAVARKRGTLPLAFAGAAALGMAISGNVDRPLDLPVTAIGALLAAAAVIVPMLRDRARLTLASGWVLLGAAILVWNTAGSERVAGDPVRHQARGAVAISADEPVVLQEIVVSSRAAPAGAVLRPPHVRPDDQRVRATVLGPDGEPPGPACAGCDDRYLAVFRLESGNPAFEVADGYTVIVSGETLGFGRRGGAVEEAGFVEVTTSEVMTEAVRLTSKAGAASEYDPARPVDLARVIATLPAAAVHPAGFDAYPAYWTAGLATLENGFASPLGRGRLLDPTVCASDQACTMRTMLLLGPAAFERPQRRLGVEIFAAADYVAPPFPPGDAELHLEVVSPSAWVHRTVEGRLDPEAHEVRVRVDVAHPPLASDVAVVVLARSGRHHDVEAVECFGDTCPVTAWLRAGESGEWSVDAYWGLFDVDGVPGGFDPQIEVVTVEEIDEEY